MHESLDYLCSEYKNINKKNISYLITKPDERVNSQLIELAKNVKNLKIVTPNKKRFTHVETKLYEEYGIASEITNNREKALLNSDIIINYDFDEETINSYNVNNFATIININKNPRIMDINYKGKVFNDYEITCNEDIKEELKNKNNFAFNILYEGLIYRKDKYENIKNQIEEDGVRLVKLF